MHEASPLILSRGGFIEYLLERDDVQQPWRDYTDHEFVQRIGDGTLPVELFKNYLIQDYLFLVSFSVGVDCNI